MVSVLRIRVAALLALLILVVGVASGSTQEKRRGRKYKTPPPVSKVEVTVLKDASGKPIENAAVIFHTLNDPGNMELKTNEDGKAVIDVLPIGESIRLQIIAKGFQTYGQDFKLDKNQLAIEIRMKRPGEQYSIYKQHPGEKSGEDDEPATKPKP